MIDWYGQWTYLGFATKLTILFIINLLKRFPVVMNFFQSGQTELLPLSRKPICLVWKWLTQKETNKIIPKLLPRSNIYDLVQLSNKLIFAWSNSHLKNLKNLFFEIGSPRTLRAGNAPKYLILRDLCEDREFHWFALSWINSLIDPHWYFVCFPFTDYRVFALRTETYKITGTFVRACASRMIVGWQLQMTWS